MLIPVILSGGSGTRLWPLSRELYPKQLLPLVGERTMLQETVLRLQGLDAAPPLVVCNDAHRFLAAEQLRQLNVQPQAIILEPTGRNTAPAIALAALRCRARRRCCWCCRPITSFATCRPSRQPSAAALPAAEAGKLVTFGIVPTAPETGYGYIRQAVQRPGARRVRHRAVRREAGCGAAQRISRRQAGTTGTAACSCSGPAVTSRSWNASRRTSRRSAGCACGGASRISTSCAWTRPPSKPAAAIPSTTR